MKRFFKAVALCTSILAVTGYLFMPSANAQRDVLAELLSIPAPPPPNPYFKPSLTDRDEAFFDRRNPPADDASSEDLLAYWKFQNRYDGKFTYAPKPSPRTLGRLIEEVEKNPLSLPEMVNVFPETDEAAAFVKSLYDNELRSRKLGEDWRRSIRRWLTYHTKYFSDELYRAASQATDTREYVTNQDEVLALARVDYDRAKPLLERMANDKSKPVTQTLALWALYKGALATNDSIAADNYRRDLMNTVENKQALPGNRDLAMDALVAGGDFPGRDDWYFSLLDDETLYDLRVNGQVYTGLTTIINHSPSDRYVAKMIELVGNSNQNIRNAAARNLITIMNQGEKNPEIVKALTPWLEDPKWAREVQQERRAVVTALRQFQIPEAVPGLIAMLNETPAKPIAGATRSTPVDEDSYPYRGEAILALTTQKSSLAAAPLRQLIPVVRDWEREGIVRAVLVSNGFTVREQIDALEFTIKAEANATSNTPAAVREDDVRIMTPNSIAFNTPRMSSIPFDGNMLRRMLGAQMVALDAPSDELVKAVIERIEIHDKRDPQLASAMRDVIRKWKGPAINSMMLRDLKNGKIEPAGIVKLLTIRAELRENHLSEVNDSRAGNPTALAVGACILEQPGDYDGIMDGQNLEAKAALLACARLIRGPISVAKVAPLLANENKLVAFAAESYLEAEDSVEARGLILKLRPDKIRVLGARYSFASNVESTLRDGYESIYALFTSVDPIFKAFPNYFFSQGIDDSAEQDIIGEFKKDPKLLGAYVYGENYVRIYENKAVYSWQNDPARFRQRDLAAEEFEALKNFLSGNRVDLLPPFLAPCEGCTGKELLMIGRAGGRRVFVNADPLPEFFAGLEQIFENFRREPGKFRYKLEDKIEGLEILFADEQFAAVTPWKNGDDFRVLIADIVKRDQNPADVDERIIQLQREYEEVEKRMSGDGAPDRIETPDGDSDSDSDDDDVDAPVRKQPKLTDAQRMEQQRREIEREYSAYAWFKFNGKERTEPVAQPPGIEFMPLLDSFAIPPSQYQWKARGGGVEVRIGDDAIYKISAGKMTKIAPGSYGNVVVTPNGRWAVATRFGGDDDEYGMKLVRINLATNRVSVVSFGEEVVVSPVSFVSALGKVLLAAGFEEEGPGDFGLLDVDTGSTQPLRGNAAPLIQESFRPLQAVGGSKEFFWAALSEGEESSTEVGIFSARTFAFKSVLKIPNIRFNSMDMWVDEPAGKIYFTYGGHLLALPLPKSK